ncbi:YqhG family protein [Brevibacillus sp. SYSU BS000544]|uniref:YqhG family protein n=1 Tax=Brevibacillus sp. SYSU BS000544 TaxID=3416443 RepID=UPI003CE53389
MEVRNYIEKYLSAFSAHIQESHPHYLTVKLPVEIDKDIGNRPFYWSWVEKMNIPPQPMILSFFFDEENKPPDIRGEFVHFGSSRLHQIFSSSQKHGRFVCLYEQNPIDTPALTRSRRSTPLTPWLCLNIKVSFICDKKRDCLLSLGLNLHHSRMVDNFYAFVRRLHLSPAIPDFYYTLNRKISLEQACQLANAKVQQFISSQDQGWAEEARQRLQDELEILEVYYSQLEQDEKEDEKDEKDEVLEEVKAEVKGEEKPVKTTENTQMHTVDLDMEQQTSSPPVSLDEFRTGGGRILDFLRMHSIPETPKEKIVQVDWKSSSPTEEKERRMAELKWQYEPRIEVQFINGGLFYLFNEPPF